MPDDGAENGEQQPCGPPDYKVFRQRRGIFSGLRKPDVPSLRDLRGGSPKPPGDRDRGRFGGGIPRPGTRGKAVIKWVAIAAAGWIALSFLAFAVSAQLQAFKLSGEAKDALHGGPLMLTSAQTILVIDKYIERLVRLADRHTIIERGRVAWQGASAAMDADRGLWHRYLGV